MSAANPWPAPAKINRFLHIIGRRQDGYHLLQTHFQFLDWFDWLRFEVTEDASITRRSDMQGVPPDTDLCVRAAKSLQAATGTALGAAIEVEKKLPMGGGLGGGSSDAATTLVALNELWRTGLSPAALAALGLKLGADVPVFVAGVAAWAEGVGEKLEPLDAEERALLVAVPRCQVDTQQIFTDPELTRDTPRIRIRDLASTPTHNDCEAVTCRLYPEVAAALDWLRQFGPAHMSGTGSSVFAYFENAGAAQAVADQAPLGLRCTVTRTLNRSPLLTRLQGG